MTMSKFIPPFVFLAVLIQSMIMKFSTPSCIALFITASLFFLNEYFIQANVIKEFKQMYNDFDAACNLKVSQQDEKLEEMSKLFGEIKTTVNGLKMFATRK